MTISKIAVYITLFLCFACESGKEVTPEIILPEPSSLEKILTRGSLEISTFYNTTDYYVYRGITRGFHYDLARDFAGYLGVNLRIVEVNNDIDTAIGRLQSGKYDLLAVSLTQTPERNEQLRFSKPLFQTREVLVQNKNSQPIKDMAQLDGKEIYIPKSATSYKKVLQQIQDSLNIHIYITEIEHYSYEDLLHLVETGEINYTVIDENIAQASSYSMKNLDIALKLKEDISVSWATHSDASLLSSEINNWLGWDWRLLAALVYTESQFDPYAESEVGAYGLMQIIPETADHFNVGNYFEPDSNVYVGTEYLHYLDRYFSSQPIDSSERLKFVLAAYNAGPGHVLDAIRLANKYGKDATLWDNNVDYYLLHKNEPEYYRDPLSKNGYCNGRQTYKYVRQVLETYNNYKNIKQ